VKGWREAAATQWDAHQLLLEHLLVPAIT
jgi:hypothetical protein